MKSAFCTSLVLLLSLQDFSTAAVIPIPDDAKEEVKALLSRQLASDLGGAEVPETLRSIRIPPIPIRNAKELDLVLHDPEIKQLLNNDPQLRLLLRQFDSLGGGEIPMNLRHLGKRKFDSIGHSSGFAGLEKRRFDAIGHSSGFGGLERRSFDSIGHNSGFAGFMDRRADEQPDEGLNKRAFDRIGHGGRFAGLEKRAFDRIGHGRFAGLEKRRIKRHLEERNSSLDMAAAKA